MFERILVAYDGSEGAKRALAKAGEIAKVAKAEIHVLTVGRNPEYAEAVRGAVDEAKGRAKAFYSKITEEVTVLLKEQGLSARTRMEFGKPGDVILAVAEELRADLLVMGTNPRSTLRRGFTGTTVDKVVEHAPCSVLLDMRP